jgi:hypothetical protein
MPYILVLLSSIFFQFIRSANETSIYHISARLSRYFKAFSVVFDCPTCWPIVLNVASNVAGVTPQCFFSNKALLYNVVSSFRAMANAGSIGIKQKKQKSGLSADINPDNFILVVLRRFIELTCSFK